MVLSANTAKYTLIANWNKQPRSNSISTWLKTSIILLVFSASTILSFFLGRHSANSSSIKKSAAPSLHVETDTNSEISFPTLPQTFIYNRTFAEGTHRTEQAWDALFPKQMGYFSHPQIAHGHRSTFSAYHYLHCLNGIRQGYWAIYEIAAMGQDTGSSSSQASRGVHHGHDDNGDEEQKKKLLDIHNLPMMISPSHVRHCIDLLRQNLMCNADLTVEVKDDEAGGVHGFGTQHQCVNWEELGGWVEAWEHKRN